MKKIRAGKLIIVSGVVILSFLLTACGGKKGSSVILPGDSQAEDISSSKSKSHSWYYFTDNGFYNIDLPQNAPLLLTKAWTEAVRISTAANIPSKEYARPTDTDAYAVVNRLGILALNGNDVRLYQDKAIFTGETADSLVFSAGTPVFCLYRSTFFNEGFSTNFNALQQSRPFLVQFNPVTKMCYPLVSYANLNVDEKNQVSGYFWDGKVWACSIKSESENYVQFDYLSWTPIVPLTDLSPALNKDVFLFYQITEVEYRRLNTPQLYSSAPAELKDLLSAIPSSLCMYIVYRDGSGTSPKSYYQEGNGAVPVNAKAAIAPASSFIAAMFEDGTTYLKNTDSGEFYAFRLPKLPGGYKYSEFCISKDVLLASWEETDFYKTGRTGFIKVDLKTLLDY